MDAQDDELEEVARELPTCRVCGEPLGIISVEELCPDCREQFGIILPTVPDAEEETEEDAEYDEWDIFADDPGEPEDEGSSWMTEIEDELWEQQRPGNYDENGGQL